MNTAHNSFIYLMGISTPVIVSCSDAKAVQDVFDNRSIDGSYPIRIGKKSFRKGQIKYIEVVADGGDSDKWSEYTKDVYREGMKEREFFLKKSPEEKAKATGMFELLFRTVSRRNPTPEEIGKAIVIQEQFYRDHPRRVLCDPALFKTILINHDGKISPWESGGFRVIENAIRNDLKLSR